MAVKEKREERVIRRGERVIDIYNRYKDGLKSRLCRESTRGTEREGESWERWRERETKGTVSERSLAEGEDVVVRKELSD